MGKGEQDWLGVGACATLACLWEATAAKPGNVYRGADFDDLTYADFVVSAAISGPIVGQARERGVGATVLAGVRATQAAVGTNTNLGLLLLIAPLAAVPVGVPLAEGMAGVLAGLTRQDCEDVYAAIRAAQPGGLGEVAEADVRSAPPGNMTLLEAMRLGAERDLVARQYVDGFLEVFWTAERVAAAAKERPLGESIVHAYLELMAAHPDSLIARKCGRAVAEEAALRAAAVIECESGGRTAYGDALADLDFWLRGDGHRRNPGTSADLIGAALFVLLREGRVEWPVRFY
jgi:triphosphoribosyl-dephospho-CoA synthase